MLISTSAVAEIIRRLSAGSIFAGSAAACASRQRRNRQQRGNLTLATPPRVGATLVMLPPRSFGSWGVRRYPVSPVRMRTARLSRR